MTLLQKLSPGRGCSALLLLPNISQMPPGSQTVSEWGSAGSDWGDTVLPSVSVGETTAQILGSCSKNRNQSDRSTREDLTPFLGSRAGTGAGKREAALEKMQSLQGNRDRVFWQKEKVNTEQCEMP